LRVKRFVKYFPKLTFQRGFVYSNGKNALWGKHLDTGGYNTMRKNFWSVKSLMMVVVLVLAAVLFAAQPAQALGAAGVCPAPGTGLAGALNMLHDATMWTIPMARDAAQGNAGMFIAVNNTACP
jgi:hypothetical protein